MKTLVRGNRDKGTTGPVHDAQFLLAFNRWNVNFHPGPRDGIFGPQMGEAIRRAKWYLGYPSNQIVPVFGDVLYHYLLDKSKGGRALPPRFQARKLARRPKPSTKRTLVGDYARWAVANAYAIDYGQVRPIPFFPWRLPFTTDCSGFVTLAYHAADALDAIGSDGLSGNTDTLQAHGRMTTRAGMRLADLVFYDSPEHVGIFMGNGMVIEHGGVGAPRWEPVNYRTPVAYRSYLP
jgi:NlpC/P60 family